MIVELVSHQKGVYPDYMNNLLLTMEMFFEILDMAEDQQKYNQEGV